MGAALALGVGCGGDAATPPSLTDTTQPADTADTGPSLLTSDLQLSMAERAPSTARVTFTTATPCPVHVDLTDGERSWSLAFEAATDHVLPLVGGRADRTVDAELHVSCDGAEQTLGVSFRTPPLPDRLDEMVATVHDADAMEPGYTLLDANDWLLLLDEEGQVVWYAVSQGAVHELAATSRGTYRYLAGRTHIREVDPFGEVVGGFRSARVSGPELTALDVDIVHHDVLELPDGSFAALSVERRTLSYPSSEVDPDAPYVESLVAGDVLVRFDASGATVSSWPLLDRLQPDRVTYDGVSGNYWDSVPTWENDDVKDWGHGNAVHHDPATGRFLVGLRHQDAVVAMEPDGEVAWILAPPANWSPPYDQHVLAPEPTDLLLPYHMHGAKFTASDRVILFDNGNRRASAFEEPEPVVHSRAVEYEIDEASGTFRELWSYGLEEELFSGSLGDADRLPTTDNVLITWGNVAADPRGVGRIQEVTRDGRTVFDLWLPGTLFRAQRVPGLLP